jgi:NAD-dependent SIR2 family protein deacetylase
MLTAQSSKLEPLADQLKKEEPKVVVVVGAGVSIGATS